MAVKPKKVMQQPMANLTPRPQDFLLTPENLRHFRLFRDLKKAVPLERFPGTMVLRRYRAGEVICRQGEYGYSAFYLPFLSDAETCQRAAEGPLAEASEEAVAESEDPQELATVVIMTEDQAGIKPRKRGWFSSGKRAADAAGPSSIPIDGPEDIDRISGIASLREGDIFGEATCLRYTPRSATVIAARDCYAIEFLRNILDHLCRDVTYRAYIEQAYRERALKGHLRQLPLFRAVDEDVLDELRDGVRLEFIDAGSIVIEEGSLGDCLYLVRRGVVQVVRGLDLDRLRIEVDDVQDWTALCREIVDRHQAALAEESAQGEGQASQGAASPLDALKARPAKRKKSVLEWLNDMGVGELVEQLAGGPDVTEEQQAALAAALTQLAHSREFLAKLPAELWQRPGLARTIEEVPSGVKGIESVWTDVQVRTAGRRVVHELFPECVRPPRAPRTIPHVLAYLAPGECFGELGVLGEGTPRTATCIVYEHAQSDMRTQAELVRVDGPLVRRLAERSLPLRKALDQLADQRKQSLAAATADAAMAASGFQSGSDELGLAEGQQLLLIDLDRCTRCGDCVRACVNTHDDGRTRLFLDGPRYRRYMIPSACRQCVDPVCMIGCPVGSIHRGDQGEIRIESWCIGCELCAKQCPYDSIQMHDVGVIPSDAEWRLVPATSMGNGRPPRGKRSQSVVGAAPILWSMETEGLFSHSATAGKDQAVIVADHSFRLDRQRLGRSRELLLAISVPGLESRVWLNGAPCELEKVFRRKKLVGYESRVPVARLKRHNTLVLELRAGGDALGQLRYGEELLGVRLDAVPPVEELNRKLAGVVPVGDDAPAAGLVEIKMVEQQAVVCDLCAGLPTGPACVAMCPHDAAIRVNGHEEMGVRL